MKSFWSQAWERLNSSTPIFFKKIIKAGVSLGGVGGGLIAPGLAPSIHWPAQLTTIGSYLLIIGAVAAAVAKFACDDPPPTVKP